MGLTRTGAWKGNDSYAGRGAEVVPRRRAQEERAEGRKPRERALSLQSVPGASVRA